MKKLLTIYNTFKCNNDVKEKETLNDIIKGTKSVLANKIKFKEYIKNYAKTTEKYTFKTPGILDYPVFKKKSHILIPVKTKRINFYEDLNKYNNEKNNEDSSIKPKTLLFLSPRDSSYKNKLLHNINILETSRKIFQNKLYYLCLIKKRNKKERYNSLFLDFFYKWNNEQIKGNYTEKSSLNNFSSRDYIDCSKREAKNDNNTSNIEHIKNEKYSELKYDDNKIFNEDYSKFIDEKIEYIKNNKIENIQEKLESSFNDSNGKEIKLKLESVKIYFKQINNKKKLFKSYNNKISNNYNENTSKDIILYVPLYYAFLLCYNNIELFKHILVSSITFNDNFESISFNDKTISSVLKTIYTNDSSHINKDFNFDLKKGMHSPVSPKKNMPFRKLVTKNYTNFTNALFGGEFKVGTINSVSSFNASKSNILENAFNNKKKEEIIHSNNRNRNRNTLHNMHFISQNNDNHHKHEEGKKYINNNSNSYNEYIFLWETSEKTFIVTVQMPMIYFKYKNLKNEIVAFCDRNLFLYLYKNNFINWDFYSLNFLFSIKAFRRIILNNYSINKKILYNDIFHRTINNDKTYTMNNFLSFRNKGNNNDNERYNNHYINENKKYDILNELIIINSNKNKIYNILNENNESYLFFYTDNLYNNSIIKLYSYLIVIDYEKLNPKLKWKYYLDFKQMKQLNEITKYESLDSFLPKIIKTDFQNGILDMDFSLFNEFDIEILGYEKKNIIKSNKTKNKNKTIGSNNTINNSPVSNELNIDIQFPFIEIEKIVNDDNSNSNISLNTNKVDLDINFLQKINNYKINSWSNKILELLNDKGEITNSAHFSPTLSNKKIAYKNKININNNPTSSPKSSFSNPRKFLKSISFNAIPITSKYH